MDLEIERRIVRSFIDPRRQDRFSWMLESPKRRPRIFADLRDVRHFNQATCTEITGNDKRDEHLPQVLRVAGMRDSVYLISSRAEFDGKVVALEPFIANQLWSAHEVIGYCVRSGVGFFANHEYQFYLLQSRSR